MFRVKVSKVRVLNYPGKEDFSSKGVWIQATQIDQGVPGE